MRKTTYVCDECGKDAASGQFQVILDVGGKTVTRDACSKECMAKALFALAQSVSPDPKRLEPFGSEKPSGGPCRCTPVIWTMTPPDTSMPGPRKVTCRQCGRSWVTEVKAPVPAQREKPSAPLTTGESFSEIVTALEKFGIAVNLVDATEKWDALRKTVVLEWIKNGAPVDSRPHFLPHPSRCRCPDQLQWVVEGTEAVCRACWAAWEYSPAAVAAEEARLAP